MSPSLAVKAGTQAGLIERERELGLIADVLGAASRGDGALVLVEGEAGIGKSALLAAAGERAAAAGLAVLAARGQDAEREFPFGGCLQLFERVLAEPARRERLLVGAAELARPLLAAPESGAAADAPSDADRIFGLLHGLYWLTANLADDAALLLLVDDAQWLDEPTLRFLRYLAVRIDELPVAVLVARRSGEPAHEQLAALAAEPSCPRIVPAPLTGTGVAAIVRAALAEAEPAFCDACAEHTGGNPLYVVELVGAIREAAMAGRADEGARVADLHPRAVSTSVLARVARRGRDATELARAVAIAGDGTSLGRASALAALDLAAGAAAADALAEAGVVRAGEPLGFVHPLVREAVYDDIPPASRAVRHGEAARLLHGEGADPELVSSQLLRAPGSGERWAVEQLRIAARTGAGSRRPGGRHPLPRAGARAALPALAAAGLLAECALAARLTGAPDALDRLEQAIELTTDGVERARLLKTMGQALLDLGRMVDAAAAFERGLEELAATDAQEPELLATLRAGVEICGATDRPAPARSTPWTARSANASRATRASGRCWPSWPSSAGWRSRRRATRCARSRSAPSATGRPSWTGTARGRPCSWSSRSGCARSTRPVIRVSEAGARGRAPEGVGARARERLACPCQRRATAPDGCRRRWPTPRRRATPRASAGSSTSRPRARSWPRPCSTGARSTPPRTRSTSRTPTSDGEPAARTSTSSRHGRGSPSCSTVRRMPSTASAPAMAWRARGERATRRSTRGVPVRRSRRCASGERDEALRFAAAELDRRARVGSAARRSGSHCAPRA